MRNWLTRYWFYPAMMIAFAIGLYVPTVGGWLREVSAVPYLVALAFFLNGFTLPFGSLLNSLQQWRLLLAVVVITFVISPLLVAVARMLLPGGDTLIGQGFQLVAVVPTMLVSAVVLTRAAKGDGAVALFLTVAANLLAILLVPLVLLLTMNGFDTDLQFAGISQSLTVTVLFPTVVGQLARRWLHTWVVQHDQLIATVSQSTILLFMISGLTALPQGQISAATWVTIVTVVVVLRVTLLFIGWLAGYVIHADLPTRRALTFCSSEKSMVFFILLWEQLYAVRGAEFGLVVLPGILFYVVELVTDSALAQWWGQKRV